MKALKIEREKKKLFKEMNGLTDRVAIFRGKVLCTDR